VTPSDSFADVMARLQVGDQEAAFTVFERFAGGLIARARRRLGTRLTARVDPEDVVQSAYRSFFHRHAEGQFRLENWESLWALLVVITLRKCANQLQHYQRECRAVGREAVPTQGSDSSASAWQAAGREPTPQEEVLLAETVASLLAELEPPEREIIALSLQGYTVAEIKEQLGRAERSVRRVRERFRQKLERLRAQT
jgi:RNA polymerase sigma-70 factor (ECF subfamily)